MNFLAVPHSKLHSTFALQRGAAAAVIKHNPKAPLSQVGNVALVELTCYAAVT
jgi:hypothetical protein